MKIFTCLTVVLNVARASFIGHGFPAVGLDPQGTTTIQVAPFSLLASGNTFSGAGIQGSSFVPTGSIIQPVPSVSDGTSIPSISSIPTFNVARLLGGLGSRSLGGFNTGGSGNNLIITSGSGISSSGSVVDENIYGGSITSEIQQNLGVLPVGHVENLRSIKIVDQPPAVASYAKGVRRVRIIEEQQQQPEYPKATRTVRVIEEKEQPEFQKAIKTVRVIEEEQQPEHVEYQKKIRTVRVIEEQEQPEYQKEHIRTVRIIEEPSTSYPQKERIVKVDCDEDEAEGNSYKSNVDEQIIKLVANNYESEVKRV